MKPRQNPLIDLAAVAGYSFYLLSHVVFSALVVPVFLVLYPFGRLRHIFIRRVFGWYVHFLTHVYLPLLRVYRIAEISGFEQADNHRPAVYVANHRSRIDGPFLLGIIRGAGVLIKTNYARNPLYTGLVKYLDFVSVDSRAFNSLLDALEDAKRLLSQGKNLLVFPEGTRSLTGRLLPFRDMAFRIAMAARVPVIPVVIHSDVPFMGKRRGSLFPGKTFTFTVRCLEPLYAGPDDRPADLAERAAAAIEKELVGLDTDTPWQIDARNAERAIKPRRYGAAGM